MICEVKRINGLPTLTVDGKPISEMAYITYKTDCNCYDEFASCGIKLFSVNLNFSEMAINEHAPVLVFQKGIFEKETPDFTIVDHNIQQILDACPDAYIFPRVNVNLSEKWEQQHPSELCDDQINDRKRVSFSSDIWAEEVKRELKLLIEYVEQSPYADHIIGYQIAGGNTEEWLPFERQGFYNERAKIKFLEYCKINNLTPDANNYFQFASDLVAERIIDFSSFIKELTQNKKIVGVFYGYTLGCPERHIPHHSLDKILKCDTIDFICSPIVYVHMREPGLDLYPMVPVDSLRLHNKLYFSENDIRTHLSKPVLDHPHYTKPIWYGPQDKNLCIGQLKQSFSRAFIKGYGMWWFDMWGGWYNDEDYMPLISKMSEICSDGMDTPNSDCAIFVDEKCFSKLNYTSRLINNILNSVGIAGISYDVYLASDFEEVYNNYNVFLFIEPCKTELLSSCILKAKKSDKVIKIFTEADNNLSPNEIRDIFISNKIDVTTVNNTVIYSGKKHVCVYANESGKCTFELDGNTSFYELFTDKNITFPMYMNKGDCVLFKI